MNAMNVARHEGRWSLWGAMALACTVSAVGADAAGQLPDRFGKSAMSRFGGGVPVWRGPAFGGRSSRTTVARPHLHTHRGHHHHFGGLHRGHFHHAHWHGFPAVVVLPGTNSFGWFHVGTPWGVSPFGAVVLPPFNPGANLLLGPGALANQVGLAPRLPVPNARPQPAQAARNLVLVRPQPDAKDTERIRRANDAWRARAVRTVAVADKHFREGNHRLARQRYQDALKKAPDLIEAHIKIAVAEVALGRYGQAIAALRKAQRVGRMVDANVDIDQLYPDPALLRTHRDKLADAVGNAPQQASMLYLLATHLHFSGERDRAAVFFQRVLQLDPTALFVRQFLPAADNNPLPPVQQF